MSAEPVTPCEQPLKKAALTPNTWGVSCPSCGTWSDVDQVREDDAGAFHADGPDQFFHCEECGAFLEVIPVTVQQAPAR